MISLTRALALAAVCAVLCAALAAGVAAYDDFPYQGLDPDALIVDEWGFYKATCTSFVCWRMIETNGVVEFGNHYAGAHWGDASHWDDAARSLGITVDDVPAPGAIAQTDRGSDLGHVAWVAAVDGDRVTIEEYNFGHVDEHGRWTGARAYNTRTVPADTFVYIHVKDLEGTYDVVTGTILAPESETAETGNDALEAAAGAAQTDALTRSDKVTAASPAPGATKSAQDEAKDDVEPRSIMPTVIVIAECVLALAVIAIVAITKLKAKTKTAGEERKLAGEDKIKTADEEKTSAGEEITTAGEDKITTADEEN